MTVSGAPNRFFLAVLGLLLLALGAGTLLAATGLLASWGYGVDPGDPLLADAAPPAWLPAAILGASISLALLGLGWIITAIPQHRRVPDLRLHRDARNGMTRLNNPALHRVIEESAAQTPGVLAARARVGGTADHPELLLELKVHERSDIQGCMEQIHGPVCAEVEQTLEAALTSVRLVIDPVHQHHRSTGTTTLKT